VSWPRFNRAACVGDQKNGQRVFYFIQRATFSTPHHFVHSRGYIDICILCILYNCIVNNTFFFLCTQTFFFSSLKNNKNKKSLKACQAFSFYPHFWSILFFFRCKYIYENVHFFLRNLDKKSVFCVQHNTCDQQQGKGQ